MVSAQGTQRCQAAREAGLWRMPLNLHMPGKGSFASQVSGLLAGPGQGTRQPSAPEF